MATKQLATVPKISVRIWRPVLKQLNVKLEAACLRRDAFLSKVLAIEAEYLNEEVSIPNSQASYNHVAAQLSLLDSRDIVSLAISPEVANRINEVCTQKKIVRDAFFNRLFLLLVAPPELLDKLLFSYDTGSWRKRVWQRYGDDKTTMEDSMEPLAPATNPLWAVREGMLMNVEGKTFESYIEPDTGKTVKVERNSLGEMIPQQSVYTAVFDMEMGSDSLIGLNCFLPDSLVPQHPMASTKAAEQAKWDEIVKQVLEEKNVPI